MRSRPRFAFLPLAALVLALPIVGLSPAAGAATVAECAAAFEAHPTALLSYTSDPPARTGVLPGQPVHLAAAWDPAFWDRGPSAAACVTVDGMVAETLGASTDTPGPGLYNHTFTAPGGGAGGVLLCARIRLSGDPTGEVTEAVWVSKTHCFAGHPEEAPSTTTTLVPSVPPTTSPPATQPPVTTTTTVPVAVPAASTGDVPPAAGTADATYSPDGGGSPIRTPSDRAGAAPSAGPGASPDRPDSGVVPLLPATGNGAATLTLLRHGGLLLLAGLALLVAFGRPRPRPRPARSPGPG